jgi:hypothetical protein
MKSCKLRYFNLFEFFDYTDQFSLGAYRTRRSCAVFSLHNSKIHAIKMSFPRWICPPT